MDFHQLLDEDRAVSPVIGVILMVAITVILAAVIGTFVLGLGDQMGNTTPRAQFGFDQGTEDLNNPTVGGGTSSVTAVRITHESGDEISSKNVRVTVNGVSAYTENDSTDNLVGDPFSGSISAGTSTTVIAASDNDSITPDTSKYQVDTSTDPNTLEIIDGAGSTVLASGVGLSSGDTVRVTWAAGDNSATLATHEI